jgi:hypothetical protein
VRKGTVVGSSVTVPVGVKFSAPIWVTVGVNVRGVGVEVAKRFWVGAGVMLGVGVLVLAGMGVGVRSRLVTSEIEAQLDSSRVGRSK